MLALVEQEPICQDSAPRDRATEINELHEAIVAGCKATLENVSRAGGLLEEEFKSDDRKETWKEWVGQNLTFSIRKADRYRKIHYYISKSATLADLQSGSFETLEQVLEDAKNEKSDKLLEQTTKARKMLGDGYTVSEACAKIGISRFQCNKENVRLLNELAEREWMPPEDMHDLERVFFITDRYKIVKSHMIAEGIDGSWHDYVENRYEEAGKPWGISVKTSLQAARCVVASRRPLLISVTRSGELSLGKAQSMVVNGTDEEITSWIKLHPQKKRDEPAEPFQAQVQSLWRGISIKFGDVTGDGPGPRWPKLPELSHDKDPLVEAEWDQLAVCFESFSKKVNNFAAYIRNRGAN